MCAADLVPTRQERAFNRCSGWEQGLHATPCMQERQRDHLGLAILEALGRLIQSWKPHRSPLVTLGISLWMMPRPAGGPMRV